MFTTSEKGGKIQFKQRVKIKIHEKNLTLAFHTWRTPKIDGEEGKYAKKNLFIVSAVQINNVNVSFSSL